MIKRGLLLSIFIILLPNCLASVEELYEGTILNTQTVNTSETDFTFAVLSDLNKVSITWGSSSLSLDGYTNETNKTTETNCDEKDGIYFCVGKITFSHTNTTTKIRYYSVPVTVSKVITEVKMFRTIDNTDLLIGQQFTVKTLLENRGTIEAEDVEYVDYFSDSFMVNLADVEGCKISGRNIIFKGTIGVNGKKECTYTLTALKGISYNSKAALSYYDGMEKKETTDEKTINVANYSVSINAGINKSTINIGDDFLLTLEIKNTNTGNDISLNLNLEIPNRLKIIIKTRELEKAGSDLKWKGKILAGESENLSIAFKADYFGEFNIKYNAKYTIDNLDREISDELDINVIKPELTINIDAPVELEQDKKSKIRIKIINPEEISFNDINIKTENNLNLTNIDKVMGNADKGESFLILDSDFTAPLVDENSIFYYNVTLSYKTENGQTVITKKSIPIEVKAYKQEEAQLEEYGEEEILEEEVQEKEDIIAEEDDTKPYISMFIKLMLFIGIVILLIPVIIRFRRRFKEHGLKLQKEEKEKLEEAREESGEDKIEKTKLDEAGKESGEGEVGETEKGSDAKERAEETGKLDETREDSSKKEEKDGETEKLEEAREESGEEKIEKTKNLEEDSSKKEENVEKKEELEETRKESSEAEEKVGKKEESESSDIQESSEKEEQIP